MSYNERNEFKAYESYGCCEGCGKTEELISGFCQECYLTITEHSPRKTRFMDGVSRDEAMAFQYKRCVTRFRDRERAGQVLGTIKLNGEIALCGSFSGPSNREVIIPCPNHKGSVLAVGISGSIGISSMKLDCPFPRVQLCPAATGNQNFKLHLFREKP